MAAVSIACSSSSERGVRVELLSEPSVSAGQELASSSGSLRIDELHWTSSEIELGRCPSALAALRDVFVPEARAHGNSSPTLSAVPIVVSGTGPEPIFLGELAPAAGRYCSVRYRIAPADADAIGLPAIPGMLGSSLSLRGTYARLGSVRSFSLTSQQALDVALQLELELSSEHPLASLHFAADPERWLQALELASLTPRAGEQAMLEALAASFSVSVE
jgi:hypothetical protein